LDRNYSEQVLPIDVETSRIWGELAAAVQKAGRALSASDGLIAAAARRHGLHGMTRNSDDFGPTVLLLNPWGNTG
jgi:predicted nucleic acid-binding protein